MGKAKRKLDGAALAEWNRLHPRGADGRFVKAGGSATPEPGRARARLGLQAPAAPSSPARESTREATRNDLMRAYADLSTQPGQLVSLVHLRDKVTAPAAEITAALKELDRERILNLVPDPNRKALPPEAHEAAVSIGGEDTHLAWSATRLPPRPAPASAGPSRTRLGTPMASVAAGRVLPPTVGEVVSHAGGTYERLPTGPGEPRRYRVTAADGRDLSADYISTAIEARTAIDFDAYEREQVALAHSSGSVAATAAVSGSWSYGSESLTGLDQLNPASRRRATAALTRWAYKGRDDDPTRAAEPPINSALRGDLPMTDEHRQDIEAIDQVLTMSRTDEAITVYRGVSNGTHILPNDWATRDLKGVAWDNAGFLPTTGNRDSAETYAGTATNRGFVVRLKLRKGSPAVAIKAAPGSADDEGEIVLPRGIVLRVTKDHGPSGDYGMRLLDVEIVAKPKAGKRTTSRQRLAPKVTPR